jgi:metal-responsive CopG/Arc/MetJ family transcriptional regulator
MARFSITLPDSLHEALTNLALKKQISLSKTIRELIESGLEIERLTEESINNSHNGKDTPFSHEKEKILWKNVLAYTLETRVLTRVLFGKILEGKYQDVNSEIARIKGKAEARVLGLLDINEDK